MGTLSSLVFAVLCASVTANNFAQFYKCACPVVAETCPRKRDFIAERYINASNVALISEEFPTIGDIIFDQMQQRYSKGLDYFTLSLATDGNPTIDPADDHFTTEFKCYHADMNNLGLTLPNGNSFTVDLELRSRALDQGVSVEICNCKDKNDPFQFNGRTFYRRCGHEVVNYLRERAEYRMTDLVDFLRSSP